MIARGRLTRLIVTASVASALMLVGCTSLNMRDTAPTIVMGDNVCVNEATQIYFGNNDDQLSLTAAQVVSELSNKLKNCPMRKIVFVAVSGNDGAPATATVSGNRIKIVGDILASQGVDRARFVTIADGAVLKSVPRGPIGGVLVMTKR